MTSAINNASAAQAQAQAQSLQQAQAGVKDSDGDNDGSKPGEVEQTEAKAISPTVGNFLNTKA